MKRILAIAFVSTAFVAGIATLSAVAAQSPRNQMSSPMPQISWESRIKLNQNGDPLVEERNLKYEFRGINLTPQQLKQIQEARRQYQLELKQVVRSPFGEFVVVVPQTQAERRGNEILRDPIVNYIHRVSEMLTPEQLRIWQQNLESETQD